MIISADTLETLILAGIEGPELMEIVRKIEADTQAVIDKMEDRRTRREQAEAKALCSFIANGDVALSEAEQSDPAFVEARLPIEVNVPAVKARNSNAERQARYRQRRQGPAATPVTAKVTLSVTPTVTNVTDQAETVTQPVTSNVTRNVDEFGVSPLSPSPLSSPPTPPPIIPQSPIPPVHHQGEREISEIVVPPKPKKPKTPELTPVQELMAVLDELRAKAVVEHRQKIRKPITAHAAKLLAGKFSKAESPNEAADHMIASGWQSFEPEWLENRARAHSRSQGPAPPRPQHSPATERHFAIKDNLDKKIRELENEPDCTATIDLSAADYTAESWPGFG